MHKLLINPVSRITVFLLGAFFVMPWLLDAVAAGLHARSYATHRDLWQMAGMDVFIVLFCLACRHAYDVQDAATQLRPLSTPSSATPLVGMTKTGAACAH